MQINPPTFQPAKINNMADINQAAADEIKAKRKKPLAKLAAEFAGWQARAKAISNIENERLEAELLDKWEQGELPPSAIIATPSHLTLSHRLHMANRRIESYAEYLDKQAAPIVAELLDRVADKIEEGVLPGASLLDQKAAAFGETGFVSKRVLSSIGRLREEAEKFRTGNPVRALERLEDFIPLTDE